MLSASAMYDDSEAKGAITVHVHANQVPNPKAQNVNV
jgi:hypothetical protein